MKQFNTIIKDSAIGLAFGIPWILWGLSDEGYIRILVGLFICFISITASIKDQKTLRQIQQWKDNHEGKLVFFYPASKHIQHKIRETILPLMPSNTLQVYYDGPALTGDIDSTMMKHLMSGFRQITVTTPSLFKIAGETIHYQSLEELRLIEKQPVDYNRIQVKINKVINA